MRAPTPYAAEQSEPTETSPSAPFRAWKIAGLLLLATAWIALGLIGHDPWKVEDATSFGIAWEMAHSDFIVPRLAGEPHVSRPPLLPALQAIAIDALAPPLAAHNAARLVAGGLMVLLLSFASLAGREFSGPAFRWLPVLILIGMLGFWERAHTVSPDIGVAVGLAIALYGFALALRRPVWGGVWLGIGAAFAFGSHGLQGPVWIALCAALLPVVSATWRTRAYGATAAIAVALALGLSLPWVFALHAQDPALFARWWSTETLSEYLAFVPGAADPSPLYHLRNLPWFAWPALPLAVWTLWTRGRGFNGGLREPGVEVPAVMSAVILINLVLAPEPRTSEALPLLVPLALLAILEVDTLTRGLSAFLDWFGILTFGLLALLAWLLWIEARVNGMSSRVAIMLNDTEIGFQPTFHLGSMLVALFLTVMWVVLVRPARRSNRRAVLNWAVGVTLVWALYSTIWMPYFDSRRSYRAMIESVAPNYLGPGCVASRNLGEPHRALFNYFGGLNTVREEVEPAHQCPFLLVQYGRESTVPALAGWNVLWDGHRRGDATELFVLYGRAR